MRSKNYLSLFISSLSFLAFGVTEEIKAITENNVNQLEKCSYDEAQYRSLTKFRKNKYCVNEDNRVIEYAWYSSGNIYKNDKGGLESEELKENDEGKFLQKWSIENDELVRYRCKMEGLSVCEFNRVAIGEKIFFGYKGEKVNGEANGKGTYFWRNGDKYVGDFKNDKRDGKGTLTWVSGSKYVGDFKDDKRNGKGTYSWSNGDKYVGDFIDNKRTGKGTLTWVSGSKYVGDFKDDKRNGKGTLTWVSGDKYVGDFKDDKRNGKGTYFWKSGDKYVGDFINNKRTGKGTYSWVSGAKYEGDWVDGDMDGYGKYTYPDGDIKEGKWSNDKFIGTSNTRSNDIENEIKGIFNKLF